MNSKLQLASEKVEDVTADLEVSEAVTENAIEVAKRADMKYPVNRSPRVVAASAVYLVGLLENEKKTQQEIAEAGDVATVSIRECYRELARHEGIPLPEDQRKMEGQTEEGRGLLKRLWEGIRR